MLLIDPVSLLKALLLALLLDGLVGDPGWLYRRVPHPVVLIGRAIAWLEQRWPDLERASAAQRLVGRRLGLVVVLASALVGLGLQWLCLQAPLGWLALGVIMSSLVAQRGLYDHVAAVAAGLSAGLAQGRRAVAHIVGRDPDQLGGAGIARAAIESTAENFADGVVAPLFWGVLLGLPGMLAYKAINTADSMIGHRTPRYLDFGRFVARLDDGVNWLPARLAALLILVAMLVPLASRRHRPTPPPGHLHGIIARGGREGERARAGRIKNGWRAMWRDAAHHRSVNAGWPEAAMAGCLGLRLAGPRRYGGQMVEDAWMGDGTPDATPADIRRALRLLVRACILCGALVALGLVVSG